MFDGFMSVLVEDLARTTKSHDEAAIRRRLYGLESLSENAQRRHTRELVPRFLRRKTTDPA